MSRRGRVSLTAILLLCLAPCQAPPRLSWPRGEPPLYIINNVAFLVGVRWLVRVYAHLGQVRHRSEVVEYQLEHHREALGERLTALETLTT